MKLRMRILALAMALLVALTCPVQTLAEGEAANQAGDYLGEVYVAVAQTPEDAAKSLVDKGYAVLKSDDGKPADLNQGAGSAVKEDAAVVLGYKTTGDRAKAITDLAVMGMDGGYSFSDYRTLMAKYRDSQIRPLMERFMAAVREYRENAASDKPGNRARADAARELLNHVVEDDSGRTLGDLLLNETLQELGVDMSGMTEEQAAEERSKNPENVDLECVLMQGNADVVLLVERLVSMAADTQETTWLERLSALGPDGLAAAYGEDRPTDAAREMAAAYQDTAKAVAAGREQLRKTLLDHDAKAQKNVTADASATEESSASPDADVTDPGYEFPGIEASNVVASPSNLDPSNAEQITKSMAESLESTSELAKEVDETRTTAIYWYLKSMPYGEGTLYDLFVRPLEDVSANDYEALYPLSSVLTPGQLSGLEFLSLFTLVETGIASGEAFEAMGPGCGGVLDVAESAEVSIYAGVNREIFSDKVALTSEALRRGQVGSEWADLLSLHNFTILSWVGAAVSGIAAVATARRASALSTNLANAGFDRRIQALEASKKCTEDTYTALNNMRVNDFKYPDTYEALTIKKIPSAANHGEMTLVEYRRYKPLGILEPGGRGRLEYADAKVLENAVDLQENMDDINDALNSLENTAYEKGLEIERLKGEQAGLQSGVAGSRVAKYVTAGIFAVLAAVSVALTAIDVYNYYNVKMTPIPKYIVDVEDITATIESGERIVVRNDNAYYQVARTDAKREGEVKTAMSDFADLNGDVGKGWLALYASTNDAKEPILASSLKVVTGTSSTPDGYTTGIHEFGSDTAANLTDPRYCYNDKANGVYAYFKREAAAPAAASAFTNGSIALVGGLCLVAGAAVSGVVVAVAGRRRLE